MPECTEQIESITECILNISKKYTENVTENCTGMTKINTYITQNDGLHRPTQANMREDITDERDNNGHIPKKWAFISHFAPHNLQTT